MHLFAYGFGQYAPFESTKCTSTKSYRTVKADFGRARMATVHGLRDWYRLSSMYPPYGDLVQCG